MRNNKLIVIIVLLTSLVSALSAQSYFSDKIIRKSGKIINCKIVEVDSSQITYKYPQGGKVSTLDISMKKLDSYVWNEIQYYANDINPVYYTGNQEYDTWKNPTPELFENYEQPSTIVRLNLFTPGLLIEGKIAPKATMLIHLQSGFIYSQTTDISGNTNSSFDFVPSARIGPRFYTSLDSRKEYGKRIDYFSGTYISLPLSLTFFREHKILALDALGGFQRTLGKRGFWNIGFGAGISGVSGDFTVGLAGEFCIGFILSK